MKEDGLGRIFLRHLVISIPWATTFLAVFLIVTVGIKQQIKEAVQSLFDVKVKAVRTQNYDGKAKFRYTKTGVTKGRTAGYKKAIVQLADGDTIDFYEHI